MQITWVLVTTIMKHGKHALKPCLHPSVFTSRDRNVCCLCLSPVSASASLSSSQGPLGPTLETDIIYNTCWLTLSRVLCSPSLLPCHRLNSHMMSFYGVLLCKSFLAGTLLISKSPIQYIPWKIRILTTLWMGKLSLKRLGSLKILRSPAVET